ncbi:MAG: hypothetical protein QOJ89_785 [bacterium]|jgi:hypothetical protein
MSDIEPGPAFAATHHLIAQHWLATPTADGHTAYKLTGIVQLAQPFQGTGPDWRRETISFDVPIPDLNGMMFQMRQWTVLVTLSSIDDHQAAIDAGWAVDDFWTIAGQARSAVQVSCALAVRDSDAFISRLGYSIDLVGDKVPGPHIT